MTKSYRLILILFFIAFIVNSCSSDDDEVIPEIEEPEVQTFDALLGNKGGVHFSGQFSSNGNNISEAGFEYGEDSTFNAKSVILVEPTPENHLRYFLASGLDQNAQYYYRAFVKSSNKIYTGEPDSFISEGSIVPEIDSLSQEFAHLADTVKVFGRNFRDPNHETNLEMGYSLAEIISLNDTVIEFVVPTFMSNVTNDVRVKIDDRVASYSEITLYKPTIEKIEPIVALIGDTLEVVGNHFDFANDRNKISFGRSTSTVIKSERKKIQVVVPFTLENVSDSITLRSQLQEVGYPVFFSLGKPKINSITPLNATFREEITIKGENFDYDKSRNKVYFGEVEAVITYADKNTLKVLVPDDLQESVEDIKVFAQLQSATFEDQFQLLPPEINFINKDIHAGQNISIEGKNFHPIFSRNKVTIEAIPVNVTSGNSEVLETKIPLGPFPRRKAKVKVSLLDIEVEYEVDLNIIDKWVMLSDSLPFRFRRGPNNAVVVNNEAYILAKEKDNFVDDKLFLWKFNSSDYSWEKINNEIPEHATVPSGILETNGDEIFYYTANNSNDFYKYVIEDNKWVKMSKFPGNRRDYSAHFTVGKDIFIGLGTDLKPYTPVNYTDFYKFNSQTNEWSQISALPLDIWGGRRRTGMASFVINDIAYLAGGADNTGDYDAWSYYPESDTWRQIADFPITNHEGVGFQLNDLGYVTGGAPVGGSRLNRSWVYLPSTDTWEEGDSIIEGRGWHFSFVLNGKAYIGGGDNDSGGSPLDNFYEFIP